MVSVEGFSMVESCSGEDVRLSDMLTATDSSLMYTNDRM